MGRVTGPAPEILEALELNALIESSESSNRMEGICAPRERIEALAAHGEEPRDRSEEEIAGYIEALRLIHESAGHMPFSINVILQLHAILYRYSPARGGRWKPVDNEIVERHPDGSIKRTRFKPVSAIETPQAMEDLIGGYHEAIEKQRLEPLIVIPLAIFDFLAIHPFLDGNGRLSRLLTILLLHHFGYHIGRNVSLERIIEEMDSRYYAALEETSPGWHEGKHDPLPWLRYNWDVIIRGCQKLESSGY
jgi:Fic family protein